MAEENAIAADISQTAFLVGNTNNITITVGSSGNVTTVNAAIALATRMRPLYKNFGTTVTVHLLAGFVMREEVNILNQDLGFVTITSADAYVVAQESFITGLALFYGWNSVLPNIDCIFQSDAVSRPASESTGKIGYYANANSKGLVAEGAGFRNFSRWNLRANSGSILTAQNAIATGGGISWRGLYCNRGSSANAEGLMATGNYYGIVSNCSTVRADASNVSSCVRGLFALSTGRISAVDVNADSCTEFSIYAFEGGVIDAQNGSADNCTGAIASVYAFVNSTINFRSGSAVNATGTGIRAEQSSIIEAENVTVNSADANGVFAFRNSTINFNSGTATNAGVHGIYASNGSIINAALASGSNAGGNGVFSFGGSTINFSAGYANNAGNAGIIAEQAATVNADAAQAINAAAIGVYANRGSTINFQGGTATGYVSQGVYANGGSHINAGSANARKAGVDTATDIVVLRGSTINADSATGGLSKAANSSTQAGIIWQ